MTVKDSVQVVPIKSLPRRRRTYLSREWGRRRRGRKVSYVVCETNKEFQLERLDLCGRVGCDPLLSSPVLLCAPLLPFLPLWLSAILNVTQASERWPCILLSSTLQINLQCNSELPTWIRTERENSTSEYGKGET